MVFTSRYDIDVPSVDVVSYVFDTKARPGDKPVFVSADDPAQAWTKDALQATVQQLAAGLRAAAGVRDRDVVLLFAENSTWYPVVVLGVLCAGGIFTGANPDYTAPELQHQLRVSGARTVLASAARYDTARQAAAALGIPPTAVYVLDGEGGGSGAPRVRDLLNHGSYAWPRIEDAEVLAERIAVLNFSSGTTGLPKACMVTHRNLVANAAQTLLLDRKAGERQGDPDFTRRDVHCAYVPLYHAMGLLTFCVVNVRRCCSTVVMRKFGLEALLAGIERFRVTYLLLVPPVALLLLKSRALVARHDVSSVRYLLCGAAPLAADASAAVERLFAAGGARSRQGWGMTEATMAVTLFAPDEHDPTYRGVGYLVPGLQMKVVRVDGGGVEGGGAEAGAEEVEAGIEEPGEALVRGPNVFRGYYGDPAASAAAWTADGWLRTGDVVVVQADGLVRVVDRNKELIKVKGFQVAPSELEGHLIEHDGVQDCAVIRVERDGRECPQAHVVRKDASVTADDLLRFMEGRLAAHKRLTGGIVFTDAIPKSSSGKILRRLLKDPHAADRARL